MTHSSLYQCCSIPVMLYSPLYNMIPSHNLQFSWKNQYGTELEVLLWTNPVIHMKIPFLYICKYDAMISVPSLTPPNSYISYTRFVIIKMSHAVMQLLCLQVIRTVCTYLLFWWWIVVMTHPKIRGVFVAVIIQPFTHVVSKVKTPVVIRAEFKVNDNEFRLRNSRFLIIQPQ